MDVRAFTPPAGLTVWPHVSRWGDREWGHWLSQQGWSNEQVATYLIERRGYGVGVTVNGVEHWLYQPTPRQVEFHRARAANVFYGGAAGGAKSHALRWEAYRRCLAVPGFRALLFRRTYQELLDNHIDEAVRETEALKALGVSVYYRAEDKRVIFRHPNGPDSWLRFAHCENEGDEEKYLSSSYELVELDELATFTQKQALAILSRVRSPLEGVTPMSRSASNPGGAHTLWVLDWFVHKTVTEQQDPFYDPRDWDFIGSKLYDNPWLMDPDGTFRRYEKRLGGLSPERRRQMLEGDWSAIDGAFFSEWRDALHVREVDVPPGCEYFAAMDWGYNSPGCVGLFACLPDGHLHLVWDWKFRQLTVEQFAEALKKKLAGKKLRYLVVDPATKQKTGAGRGESIFESLLRRGFPMRPGDHDRYNGAQRVHELLATAPDGVPWLTVDPACAYTRRTLPTLVSDPHDPDDVDTKGDDHGYDMLRYGAMSRPSPSVLTQETPIVEGSLKYWRQYHERREKASGVLA